MPKTPPESTAEISSHISFGLRKLLLMKLLLFEEILRDTALKAHQSEADRERFKIEEYSIAQEEEPETNQHDRLDQRVTLRLYKASAFLTKSGIPPHRHDLKMSAGRTANNLRMRTQQIDCRSCAIRNPSGVSADPVAPDQWLPCRGRTEHAGRVSKGDCTEPLRALFSSVYNFVRQIYVTALSRHGLSARYLPKVFFATEVSDRYQTEAKTWISAVTRFVDVRSTDVLCRRQSQVVLKVNVREFRWRCYSSVLYLLFHELVCHAFQDVLPGYIRREGVAPNDAYCEGWMDHVANELFHDWLGRISPVTEWPLDNKNVATRFRPFRNPFREGGSAIHGSRLVVPGRMEGNRSARTAWDIIEAHPNVVRISSDREQLTQLRQHFLDISFMLNVDQRFRSLRDSLASHLHMATSDDIDAALRSASNNGRALAARPVSPYEACLAVANFVNDPNGFWHSHLLNER